jgi:glycosyltransferase involved in cell wall biosynthesis
MGNRLPQVSIGVPVYNAENYLEQSLGSLLAQTFEDFELVISDNGSTDNTEAICRRYAKQDERVRYHREERNRGAVWNFDRVFELSRGEYFKWAAHDDLCVPTYLERCVEALDRDPCIVWCHTWTNHIDEEGNLLSGHDDPEIPDGQVAHSLVTPQEGRPNETRGDSRPSSRFAAVLLGTTWCSDSYGLIRSSALARTRMYQRCYGAEKILMGELSLQGRFHEIPEQLFFQRTHLKASGNLTTLAEQLEYVLSGTKSQGFASARLKLLWGHARGVVNAGLPLVEKGRCGVVLVRYLLQMRKWKQIARQLVTGASLATASRQPGVQAVQNAPMSDVLPAEPVATHSSR